MRLSETIVKAIRSAVEEAGSQVEFAAKTGIKQQNIHRYVSGKVESLSMETWLKLYPHIKRHLPDSFSNQTHSPHPDSRPLCAITKRDHCPFDDSTPAKRYLIDIIDKLDDDLLEPLIAHALEIKNAPNVIQAPAPGDSSHRKTKAAG